jgi:hypothetical protein
MTMSSRDIWIPIYEQIHEHLRESARKRDQVILFYILLLVALIGAWDKLGNFLQTALTGTWLVGVVCFVVATQYRRWHIVHHCSMVVLQRLMADTEEPSLSRCKEIWNKVNDTKTSVWMLMNPLRGVETTVMYLLALLTFVPAYELLKNSKIAIILGAVVYVGVLLFLSSGYVRKFHEFREDNWMFRWLRGMPESGKGDAEPNGQPKGMS